VPDLMRALRAAGHDRISRRAVEDTLVGHDRFLADEVLGRTRWRVDPDWRPPEPGLSPAPVPADGPLDGLHLRDWQVEAFAAWAAASCRGVVEAVTGAGKTRLAMAAVRVALGRGGRALVLVPTIDLQ